MALGLGRKLFGIRGLGRKRKTTREVCQNITADPQTIKLYHGVHEILRCPNFTATSHIIIPRTQPDIHRPPSPQGGHSDPQPRPRQGGGKISDVGGPASATVTVRGGEARRSFAGRTPPSARGFQPALPRPAHRCEEPGRRGGRTQESTGEACNAHVHNGAQPSVTVGRRRCCLGRPASHDGDEEQGMRQTAHRFCGCPKAHRTAGSVSWPHVLHGSCEPLADGWQPGRRPHQ